MGSGSLPCKANERGHPPNGSRNRARESPLGEPKDDMNRATENRRTGMDRRARPTPFLSRYTFTGGRRKTVRRETDKRRHIFVDLYETKLFIGILVLLTMNVLDGFFTLLLVRENIIIEANPLMAFFLDYGQASFFWVKYLLMAVSLLIICIFRSFRFSRVALIGSLFVYSVVISYHLRIISEHRPILFP